MLELPAAAEIVANANTQDITTIRAAALAYDAGGEGLPFQKMRALNHAFHRALTGSLHNTMLASLFNELRERDLPGDWSNWTMTAKVRQSSRDHLEIMDAIEAARLHALIRAHLTRWKNSGSWSHLRIALQIDRVQLGA